jgi:hypothetical protein
MSRVTAPLFHRAPISRPWIAGALASTLEEQARRHIQ